MKPVEPRREEHCKCCGAVLDNIYKCKFCGTVYLEETKPQPKEKPDNPFLAFFYLLTFPVGLFMESEGQINRIISRLERRGIKTLD